MVSDTEAPSGSSGGPPGFQPRWRLNLADDGTVDFDPTTQTITKIKTGESCYLGDYASYAYEGPGVVFVQSSHAPPIGKWYVTGEEPR